MALSRPKAARIVGRYQLVAELGTSYLGPLWAVRTEGSDGTTSLAALRLVSLARLDADTRVRLLEAAWQAMEVRDARVRSVTDVVASDGELGIVSEYVEGVSLRALQGLASVRRKPLPVPVALRVVMDLADAAVALDRTTMELGEEAVPLYGGLSPDSVVVETSGRTSVLDVAVASVASSVESLGGNPERVAYSAPEQIGAEPVVNGRSDVFTLGIIAWELLSGRRLFVGSDKVVGQKVLAARIPRIDDWKRKGDPEIPSGLLSVVGRALARDPTARYGSAEELARALAECGVTPGAEEDVKRYLETIAEGALSRTRDALAEPAKAARPDTGQWGKLKGTEPIRSIPTLSVAGPERRSLAPTPAPTQKPGLKPLTVPLGGPRPRQPTMIGIPPPSRVEETLPPPAASVAPPPAVTSVSAPQVESHSDAEFDGSDEPTSQYNARDLLKQVEEMSRRSDPARRLPSEFPAGATASTPGAVDIVPPPPLVPAEVLPPAVFPQDGGWLDDPIAPDSVEAETLRQDVPLPRTPEPVRSLPDPSTSLAEAIAAGSQRMARSLAPPSPTGNSVRPPEKPVFSIPPKAPSPFIPSQIPPPLIHDPRATRKRSVAPPEGPQFTRGVVIGVVVSLGIVMISAAIAVATLRRGNSGRDDRATALVARDAPTTDIVAPPSAPPTLAAPVAAVPAVVAAPAPAVETAPDAPRQEPLAPPVTASVAAPASTPANVVTSAAPKATRRPGKKARSRFVPDDI